MLAPASHDRRQLEARLRAQVQAARSAARPFWLTGLQSRTEPLEGGSPSGCEEESGRSFVVTLREAAELVCRSEANETDASSLGERVDNIIALWDAMGHQDSCRLDAGLKNMDWIKILGTLGLQVAEPVSQDPEESFVHCILQWLLREELILPPLEEEEQRKIVSHILKRISRSVFGANRSVKSFLRPIVFGRRRSMSLRWRPL